ncbi:MAG: hypothetical protein ABIN36_13815 [Ferruginibacter sp.]
MRWTITKTNDAVTVVPKPDAPAMPMATIEPSMIAMLVSIDDFFPKLRSPAILN